MKKNIKKFSAVFSAAMIAVSAASCSNSASSKEAPTADKVLKNSYRSVPMSSDTNFGDVRAVSYVPASDKLIISTENYDTETYNTIYDMYVTDTDLGNPKKIEPPVDKPANGSLDLRFAFSDDGNIYTLACISDYGDMELPKWSDPDFDYESFDEEAFEKNTKVSYKFISFDMDGNKIFEGDLDQEPLKDEAGDIFFRSFTCINEDTLLVGVSGMEEDKYFILDSQGKIKTELKHEGLDWIDSVSTTADGNIAFVGSGEDGIEIHFLAPDGSGEAGDKLELENSYGSIKLMKGYGDYELLISTNNGLSGLKEGEVDEIVNYINSDINPQYVTDVIPVNNDEFIIVQSNWNDNGIGATSEFSRLTARDMEEMKDTKLITLAVMQPDPGISEKVTQFNKTSTGYRIQLEDYSKYDVFDGESVENSGSDQLKKDILADNAPDMIITYDRSLLNSLAPKGAFADLYSFLEKDSDLKKEDLMPPLLKCGEFDGKLYSLSPSFSISTFAVKKKFCDHDNWTVEEFMDAYKNRPEGAKLKEYETQDDILRILMYGANEFVDYKNGKCHFDDPEFVKMLEFTKQFPKDDEDVSEDMSREEWEKYSREMELAYRNDKVLIFDWDIYDVHEYNTLKDGHFGEDISLVGYPSEDGNGGAVIDGINSMMIMNDSPVKDECWKFIKGFFQKQETEHGYSYSYGLPALVSDFEKVMDESMEKWYYTEDDGTKVYVDNEINIGGKDIKIDPLSKEERDYVSNYIKSASTVRNSFSRDIEEIIMEEVKAFYADEKSAQEAADMIQSRASILVSEQS